MSERSRASARPTVTANVKPFSRVLVPLLVFMPGRRPGRGRRLAMGVLGWAVKPRSFWPCRGFVFAREMRSALGGQAGAAGTLRSRVERRIGRRGSELSQMMSMGETRILGRRCGGRPRRQVLFHEHGQSRSGLSPCRGRRGSAGRSALRPRHDDESAPRRETRAAPADEHGPGSGQARYHRRLGPVASPRLAFPVALAARETGSARHSAPATAGAIPR